MAKLLTPGIVGEVKRELRPALYLAGYLGAIELPDKHMLKDESQLSLARLKGALQLLPQWTVSLCVDSSRATKEFKRSLSDTNPAGGFTILDEKFGDQEYIDPDFHGIFGWHASIQYEDGSLFVETATRTTSVTRAEILRLALAEDYLQKIGAVSTLAPTYQ